MTDEPLFLAVGRKVQCQVCGASGYPDAPWQEKCRKGHPFVCDDCGKAFTTKSGLSSHQKPRRPTGGHQGAARRYSQQEQRLLEALAATVDMACHQPGGKLDSGGIDTYAGSIRLLAQLGRVEIESEAGHQVTAHWIEFR